MNRALVAALATAAASILAACQTAAKEDAGPVVTKDFKVGDFKQIGSSGNYEVTVKTGAAPSVRAEGPQNMLDHLVVEVDGDELKIHPKKNLKIDWTGRQTIRISVTVPELRGAAIAGSGTMTVDKVAGDKFDASVAGSGELHVADAQVQALELAIAGSGSAMLAGRADTADYSIAGSGDVDAAKLRSRDIKLSIAGSGNIKANATGTVEGAVMGSGDASITGGATCKVSKMGSGDISCS